MKLDKKQFFADLTELLESESQVDETTVLTEMEEFDSLAIMSLVAYADQKFARRLPASAFNRITTVASLMDVMGAENFD